ncbi:uncharacterized protein PG986_009729 [Apiospora aurea]|uniref:Mid2 domain-containing protein n=1 Tax=Apiospora aurea TaxID=335848 RepID=A0ABR1Q8G8_9PEZI
MIYQMEIFDNTSPDSPGRTQYSCGEVWAATRVYRSIQGATPSTSSTTTSAADTASSTTTPATPASSTAISSSTSTETGRNTDGSSPEHSNAWIAGAVAGPIVGCILVGLLVWWIMRHRMKKGAVPAMAPVAQVPEPASHVSSTYGQYQPVAPWPTSSPPPPHGAPPGYGWEAHNKPSSPPPPPALAGSPGHMHELSNVPANTDHAGMVYELQHGR